MEKSDKNNIKDIREFFVPSNNPLVLEGKTEKVHASMKHLSCLTSTVEGSLDCLDANCEKDCVHTVLMLNDNSPNSTSYFSTQGSNDSGVKDLSDDNPTPSNNSTIEFESTVNWDCITPMAITSANTIATMASSDPTDTTPIPTVDQTPTVDNNSDLLSPKTINNPPLANPNHPASSGRKDNMVTIPANMSDSTSNRGVCDMFQQLMDKMSSIKEDLTSEIKEFKAEKSSTCDQVNSMKTQQEAQNGRIDIIEDNCSFNEMRLSQLADTVTLQNQVIQELQNKLQSLEKDRL